MTRFRFLQDDLAGLSHSALELSQEESSMFCKRYIQHPQTGSVCQVNVGADRRQGLEGYTYWGGPAVTLPLSQVSLHGWYPLANKWGRYVMTSGLVTSRGNIIIPERLRHNWSIVSPWMLYIVGDSISRFHSFRGLSRLNTIRGPYQLAQNPKN